MDQAALQRGNDDAVTQRAPRRTPDPTMEWMAALGITFVAGLLRFWGLQRPHAFEFDETYYAKDAWSLLHFGYARNYTDNANAHILAGHVFGQWKNGPEMIVHPEVGKWLIALGEWVGGMNPFGWRLAPAIIGTLMVLLMIRFTRRVTGSNLVGLTAGVLMCFDGLQFVLSRLALLDIFIAFFILLATHCMVADRDWGRARLSTTRTKLFWRPWRLAAGVCWGLALGCKWDAIYPLAAFCLLQWAWDAGARRRLGLEQWTGRSRGLLSVLVNVVKAAILDELPALGYLIVVPLLVYVASWTGWLINHHTYEANLSDTQYGPYWGNYVKAHTHGWLSQTAQALHSLWNYHLDVYRFHTKFLQHAHHTYQSNPWGWPILNRPVGVNAQLNIKPGVQGCGAPHGSTCLRQVLLLGTPALWWSASIAAIWSAVTWVTRRDWRYGLVMVGILSSWLPWFHYDDRPIFSYYSIDFEPFLILGLTLALGHLVGRARAGSARRQWGAYAAGAVVFLVALNFAWFWPIYTDGLLTNSQWLERIWFSHWI